jgi:protein-tyrosine phosphatase
MAETLMKDTLKKMDLHQTVLVESAGTWAEEGHPATGHGIIAMAQLGLDSSRHRSQPITKTLLDQFDLILTMEAGHKESIQVEFPENAEKVFMLSEMSGVTKNIDDPVGGSFEDYIATADEIDAWIKSGLPKILTLLKINE